MSTQSAPGPDEPAEPAVTEEPHTGLFNTTDPDPGEHDPDYDPVIEYRGVHIDPEQIKRD